MAGHETDSGILNVNQKVSVFVAGCATRPDLAHFLLEDLQTSWPPMWRRILTCFIKM